MNLFPITLRESWKKGKSELLRRPLPGILFFTELDFEYLKEKLKVSLAGCCGNMIIGNVRNSIVTW